MANGVPGLEAQINILKAKIAELEIRNKSLEHDSSVLAALEAGGVDNWEWYDQSIQDAIKAGYLEDI